MNELHVVYGTGAIGLALFEALDRRGRTVRLVNRSGTAAVPRDVEVFAADVTDPAAAVAAARGADVVYQVLNPPYPQWAELFPRFQENVLRAAESADARLVSMENVYSYGRPGGRRLTEDLPTAAHTKRNSSAGG